MKELLTKYTITDILVFVVIIALAVKEFVTFLDWVKGKARSIYDKDVHEKEEHEKIEDQIEDLNKFYEEKQVVDDGFAKIEQRFSEMSAAISMLIESDKEDIKAFITSQHHYFVYELGWIDDYSLDCIERRFAIYEKEHGNSFVKGLMVELRTLPKMPPQAVEKRYAKTAEYIKQAHTQEV